MRISDPNKLAGRIMRINQGADMTEIIVDIGDQAVTATITTGAAHDLNLHKGDKVFAMFNSTSVTLVSDGR